MLSPLAQWQTPLPVVGADNTHKTKLAWPSLMTFLRSLIILPNAFDSTYIDGQNVIVRLVTMPVKNLELSGHTNKNHQPVKKRLLFCTIDVVSVSDPVPIPVQSNTSSDTQHGLRPRYIRICSVRTLSFSHSLSTGSRKRCHFRFQLAVTFVITFASRSRSQSQAASRWQEPTMIRCFSPKSS